MSEPLISRYGSRYFRRLTLRRGGLDAQSEIHILDEAEQKKIRRIERGVIFRAFLAGAISATACAMATLFTYDWVNPSAPAEGWLPRIQQYAAVYGVMIVATILELGFLYWDSLRSVHALSVAAGLDMSWDRENRAVLHSLVNAALEMPNPLRHEYVDPRRETPRWRILMFTLLYKAKVSATNFILKTLVAKLGGRFVARAWLDFIAIPVTAIWDAVVTSWVIREARIRAIGPSSVQVWLNEILREPEAFSQEERDAIFRAAGAAIVRTSDLHPNHAFLLNALERRLGKPVGNNLDDTGLFLMNFENMNISSRLICLKIFLVACVIDGRIAPREHSLWRDLCAHLPPATRLPQPAELLEKFRNGKESGAEFWNFA